MISLLSHLLLGTACSDLRFAISDLIGDTFVYRLQLDRKWNWPTSEGEGLPIFRLRRMPLPVKIIKPPPMDVPLRCGARPMSLSTTSGGDSDDNKDRRRIEFECCSSLAGLRCLDDRMIKVEVPNPNDLPTLQEPMSENFGPLVKHCPLKLSDGKPEGSLVECVQSTNDASSRSTTIQQQGGSSSSSSLTLDGGGVDGGGLTGTDFNGNKVPHPLPIQAAKLPRGKKDNDYPTGDYPGGNANEEEKKRKEEEKQRNKLGLNNDKKEKETTENKNGKYRPIWGPTPVHVPGPRGGGDYQVDPNTGKTYDTDKGVIPGDKQRSMNPKTYQAKVENGWNGEAAANGGYAPGQNPNIAMSPMKGTTPSACDVPTIMAPPPWTLIPTGPGEEFFLLIKFFLLFLLFFLLPLISSHVCFVVVSFIYSFLLLCSFSSFLIIQVSLQCQEQHSL